MLWMISAVTTPLALILHLFITDTIDLFPLSVVQTTPRLLKCLIRLANSIPLLFIACAFLLSMHLLMITALAIIVIFYVILRTTDWWLPYFYAASQGGQQEHKQLFANTITMRQVPHAKYMLTGALTVMMLVSAINSMAITW